MKVHMQGHAMQCKRMYICRGMQYNVQESTYVGACNAMYSKVHVQRHAIQCNVEEITYTINRNKR